MDMAGGWRLRNMMTPNDVGQVSEWNFFALIATLVYLYHKLSTDASDLPLPHGMPDAGVWILKAEISEGPTWLEARQELAFVDIEGKAVHVWSPKDGSSWKLEVPGRPGTLSLTSQPHLLLVAMEQAIYWLDLDKRQVEMPPRPPLLLSSLPNTLAPSESCPLQPKCIMKPKKENML